MYNFDESKLFIGCKEVKAVPTTLDEFIKETGRNPYKEGEVIAEECTEGYAVMYEDGYVGYSPKGVFEKVYSEINELKATATLMLSTDYKDRFKAEYTQLKIRYEKLKAMYDTWKTKGVEALGFKPTCPRNVYFSQLAYMKHYLRILTSRAKLEGIELD